MNPLFLASALFLVFMTSATAITGNELRELCKSSNQFKRGHCMGAVEGVFGGYQHGVISGAAGGAFWHANMGRPKNTIILPPLGKMDELIEFVMPYCPPEYTTHQQVVSVGIEYLANHPKRRDENIAELLPDAFEEAWPCKE